MKPLNIIFSSNASYVLPLSVCITSVLENNKHRLVQLFIFHECLNEQDKSTIVLLVQSYNQHITFVPVAPHYFSTARSMYWSKETYYRLLAGEMLPKNIERVLHLDCDTIVNDSLDELYDIDLGEYFLAATPEDLDTKVNRKRIGVPVPGLYYQAGVILFDLVKTRRVLDYKVAMKAIQKLGSDMWAVDQDIINIVFDGKIKTIGESFNNYKITNFYGKSFDRLRNHIDLASLNKTSILHYVYSKPWKTFFYGSCEDLWYAYLKLSPYNDLYIKKFGSARYRILRTGLIKSLFSIYIGTIPFIKRIFSFVLPESLLKKIKIFYRKVKPLPM